jgi:hypothetical protein
MRVRMWLAVFPVLLNLAFGLFGASALVHTSPFVASRVTGEALLASLHTEFEGLSASLMAALAPSPLSVPSHPFDQRPPAADALRPPLLRADVASAGCDPNNLKFISDSKALRDLSAAERAATQKLAERLELVASSLSTIACITAQPPLASSVENCATNGRSRTESAWSSPSLEFTALSRGNPSTTKEIHSLLYG